MDRETYRAKKYHQKRDKAKHADYMRRYNEKRRAAGLCIGCATPLEDRRRSTCLPCREAAQKRQIKSTRGLDLSTVPFEGRYGACQICQRQATDQEDRKKNAKVLDCDHDHKTGAFRGWICHRCNSVLAAVGDDVSLLLGLADYLAFGRRNAEYQKDFSELG